LQTIIYRLIFIVNYIL